MPTDLYAALDFESRKGWDRWRLGRAVISTGDVEKFETLGAAQAWVENFPGSVWGHAAGGYDFLFLTGKDEILFTGSKILRAKCGKAKLCDSYPLFQMSLAKMGKAVGLQKLNTGTKDYAATLDDLSDFEAGEHCERDCQILLKSLTLHKLFCEQLPHRKPAWPGTSGASAVYAAEALEHRAVGHLRNTSLDLDDWDEQTGTVCGGRTELWQLGPVEGPLYVYDVKSSYPSRYLQGPMPVGPWRRVSHEVHGLPATWRVRFKQPRDRLPLLTASPFEGGATHCHDGEGWCTSEELHIARTELGADVTVLEGWVSSYALPFGVEFVSELFRLKEAGQPFAKVVFNSLHGKLGQRLITRTFHRQADGVHRPVWGCALPRWFQRPLLEGFIYARARLALWKMGDALLRAGWRVLYTDTDSLHTDCPPDVFAMLAAAVGEKAGTSIGAWELKSKVTRALYLAPKTYALQLDDGGEFVAAKGFPLHRISYDVLDSAWNRPKEIREPWGLETFLGMEGEERAQVRDFRRTLAAHPGAGKVRLSGDRVWYQH